MEKRKLLLGILVLGTLVVSAFSLTKTGKPEQNTTAAKDTLITGQELYRLNCASCHSQDRSGNPPTFPSLVDIEKKMTKSQVRELVKNGKGKMSPMAHLSEKEIAGIIKYLYNDDENAQGMAQAVHSPVKQGEMLFKSNCASCHRATPDSPKPQNAGTRMCSMMTPATLGGVDQRYTYDQFTRVLNSGSCYMPSFASLQEDDKEALYAYLESLDVRWQGKPERHWRMNCMKHAGNRPRNQSPR